MLKRFSAYAILGLFVLSHVMPCNGEMIGSACAVYGFFYGIQGVYFGYPVLLSLANLVFFYLFYCTVNENPNFERIKIVSITTTLLVAFWAPFAIMTYSPGMFSISLIPSSGYYIWLSAFALQNLYIRALELQWFSPSGPFKPWIFLLVILILSGVGFVYRANGKSPARYGEFWAIVYRLSCKMGNQSSCLKSLELRVRPAVER